MKKVFCLALCLLLMLLAASALADTVLDNGYFRYSINEETNEASMIRLLEDYVVVNVPASVNGYPVTAIGDRAFCDYGRLKTVYLPDTIRSIGSYAFANCPSLEELELPASLTTIGECAFAGSGLHTAFLPKGVTSVGKRAYADCLGLGSAVIPGSLTVVPEELFSGCRFLYGVTICEGVTTLEDCVFFGCAMEEIVLPASLTSLGVNPFINCKALKNISVAGGDALRVDNGALIAAADGRLVSFAIGLNRCGYTMPADVRVVGEAAFCQALSVQEVHVPATVEKVGAYAFWYCTNMTLATVAEGVEIDPNAFAECYQLENVIVPADAVLPELPVDPMA